MEQPQQPLANQLQSLLETAPSSDDLYSLILHAAKLELIHAQLKFPSNRHLAHAFTEEAGESIKAFLDQEQKGATSKQVVAELIQTIAMAMRLMIQGDPEFKKYEFNVKYIKDFIIKKSLVIANEE